MPRDTIAITLTGDVSLADFATAMHHFSELVHTLSEEIAEAAEIEWEILRLEAGSATAEIRGISAEPEWVESVIDAYLITGQALAAGESIPYSDAVADEARAITAILNGKSKSIRFVVADQEAVVERPIEAKAIEEGRARSFGVLTGTVETLSSRRRLKFTLYDDLFDTAIYCLLDEERREMIRGAWGKHVAVTGDIYRDALSGRPRAMRNIERIDIVEGMPPGSYRRALGVLPWKEGDPLPEELIRRVRDAG